MDYMTWDWFVTLFSKPFIEFWESPWINLLLIECFVGFALCVLYFLAKALVWLGNRIVSDIEEAIGVEE